MFCLIATSPQWQNTAPSGVEMYVFMHGGDFHAFCPAAVINASCILLEF